MSRFGFCGPSYSSQSLNADCQRLANMYLEPIESQQGKGAFALYQRPGLALFSQPVVQGQAARATAPTNRAHYEINGRAFAVIGNNLFELFADGTFAQRNLSSAGATILLPDDGLPASMCSSNPTTGNPGQLLIAAGGSAFVLNLKTNFLSQVPAASFNNGLVSQVGYCDGFFIASLRNSNQWFVSAPLDATTWPGLNTTLISVFPENIVTMLIDHREAFFAGSKRSVIYYASGNPFFPFDVAGGTFMEVGSGPAFAAVRMDNTFFWIEQSERGLGIARKAQGYTPVRVSNHAIEHAWKKYSRIDDAIGWTFQIEGHEFWVIYFPTGDATWVFDAATNQWHEWTYLDTSKDKPIEHAHRAQTHMFAFGKHLVGDRANNNIYQMDLPALNAAGTAFIFADDNGAPIRRLRRAPHISTEQQWIFHSELQLDIEVGTTPQGVFTESGQATTFYLTDSTGQLWSLQVNDTGQFLTTQVAAGAGRPLTGFYNDNTNTYSFQLSISPVGVLLVTSVTPFNPNLALSLPMISVTGKTRFTLEIQALDPTHGQLMATPQGVIYRGLNVMLRYSKDGGLSWLEREAQNCGVAGNTVQRVIWRRLGRSRDRIYEVSMTDPVPTRIIDAYLQASPGFQPADRIVREMAKRA